MSGTKTCSGCGAKVAKRETPPYPGHANGCRLRELALESNAFAEAQRTRRAGLPPPPDWKALAYRLAEALRAQNYVPRATGFCVCVVGDGQRPDDDHAAPCADARVALRDFDSARGAGEKA
jgi:hypothetical protein